MGMGTGGRGTCKASGKRGEVAIRKGPARKGFERKCFGRELVLDRFLVFGRERVEEGGHAHLLRKEESQGAADREADGAVDMEECGTKGRAKGGAARPW